MYIDSRPSRRRAGVSTFGKSPSCDGSITGHTSWVFLFARCTKGIVHARRTGRGRELYGTNFRHAVEFSRSGRTPSQPFRADRGQPELLYLVSSARSNPGSRPASHLVGAPEALINLGLVPRAWGRFARPRLIGHPFGWRLARLRLAN